MTFCSLLQLFANECYKTGQFLYSAKAFGILIQSDDQEEYWEGLRGACIGAFQNIMEGKESEDNIDEILILLMSSSNPQVNTFTWNFFLQCLDKTINVWSMLQHKYPSKMRSQHAGCKLLHIPLV